MTDDDDPAEPAAAPGAHREDAEFGPQGWLLLAGMVVAFVVVPILIYLNPPQLPFVFSYLVLPLVPAVLLALLAVYVTTTR